MDRKKDKPDKNREGGPAKKRNVEPGKQSPAPPEKKHILKDPPVKKDHIISEDNPVKADDVNDVSGMK